MLFGQYMRSKWLKPVLALVSIYYGFLWDLRWFAAVGVGAITYWVLVTSLPKIGQGNPARERSQYLGSLGLAVLFCLMFPIRVLTDWDNLFRLSSTLGLPPLLIRIINFSENLSITALTFGVAFCAIFLLWGWMRRDVRLETNEDRDTTASSGSTWRLVIRYAAPGLVVWAIFLYGFWPGLVLPDTYTQWRQFSRMALDDWHPVGHTLLMYLLTRIWNNPGIISIFQVLAMALAWSWAMVYFDRKGISRTGLFLLSCAFALLPFNGFRLVTLEKDEVFTIASFVLVFLLGRIWVSQGGWLERRGNQALLGVFLALPFLFRHNGLLILVLAPAALLLFYRRQWKAILTASLVAVLLVAGIRNGLAFGILKAKANPDSVMYVVPIQHISAVGNQDGEFTPEEAAVLEQIAPITVWQQTYNPYNADYISKHWGATQDPLIYDKIGRNKTGLVRTFLDLSLRYPQVVMRSELDLMNPIWAIAFIEEEPAWLYKYSTQSWEPPADLDARLFAQPNLNTPVKAGLNRYLAISNKPGTSPFFWRGGIYFFLTIMLLVIYTFTRGRSAMVLFVPSLANILSLFLTMPMQNFRYLYPFIACVPLLVLFGMVRKEFDCKAKGRNAKEELP